METHLLTEDDIPACARIFDISYEALHRTHGTYEEGPPAIDWLGPILRHFLHTDPAGARVATRDGEPVAFASGIRRDRYWFLSFLFVLPGAQGSGVGRGLLEELAPEEDEGNVRATVVESFQPVSTGLYASSGMTPRAIKYWLSGPRRPAALPRLPTDVRRTGWTPVDQEQVDRLDRRVLGFTRAADHAWWAENGTPRWAYRRRDDLVAYAYVDDGYIGPALAIDEVTLCAVVADIRSGIGRTGGIDGEHLR